MTADLVPLTTSLVGKVALVTGGAIRVGRAICQALAGRGASIAFTYLPGEPAEEAVQTLEVSETSRVYPMQIAAQTLEVSETSRVLALPMDVREPGAPQRVVEQVIGRDRKSVV